MNYQCYKTRLLLLNICAVLLILIFSCPAKAQIFKSEFKWTYNDKEYRMSLILNERTYNYYKNSDKRLMFTEEQALGKFLNIKENDNLISMIVQKLQSIGIRNHFNETQVCELAVAFVQSIPYDWDKAEKIIKEEWSPDTDILFHYETVYRQKGICTDKSILMMSILKNLGYGCCLILMDKEKHAAVGLACDRKYSFNNSGYCYVETTNYAPIGYIPQVGKAKTKIDIKAAKLFQKQYGSLFLGNIITDNK